MKTDSTMKILIKEDKLDGYIFVCPHCHSYILKHSGITKCVNCGGMIDGDHMVTYSGRVKFTGR